MKKVKTTIIGSRYKIESFQFLELSFDKLCWSLGVATTSEEDLPQGFRALRCFSCISFPIRNGSFQAILKRAAEELIFSRIFVDT